MLRNAPASRPAIVECPPSSSPANRREGSRTVASAVRMSVAWFEKKLGAHAIRAESVEKTRSPSISCLFARGGSAARTSSTDVPWGNAVILFRARGARTISCRGTVQLPAWRDSDCSGESDQFRPNRDARYAAAKGQKAVYHAVLSPGASPGRDGMYQPLMTSRRNPFAMSRSRCVRVMSRERMAALTPARCSRCRASRDSASFSDGDGIVHSR